MPTPTGSPGWPAGSAPTSTCCRSTRGARPVSLRHRATGSAPSASGSGTRVSRRWCAGAGASTSPRRAASSSSSSSGSAPARSPTSKRLEAPTFEQHVRSARELIRRPLLLFLRIFFRRLEAAGLERVPAEGPLLVVLNHPNALIDPLFILCLAVVAEPPLRILPAGLYYTAKETFRSAALVCFGNPLEVRPSPVDAFGEPPPDEVHALTARIAAALGEVTLQADAFEAHDRVARTERILASERREADDAPRPDLALEFDLRRRLLAGYGRLRDEAPERLERLRRRILRYEGRLEGAGIDPWDVPVGALSAGRVLLHTALFLLRFLLLVPLGVPGILIHFLPYRLVAVLSGRVAARHSDLLATSKALAAFLLFPLTWLLTGLVAWRLGGWVAGLAAVVLAPASGYAALRLSE